MFISCQSCGCALRIEDDLQAATIRCPKCGQEFHYRIKSAGKGKGTIMLTEKATKTVKSDTSIPKGIKPRKATLAIIALIVIGLGATGWFYFSKKNFGRISSNWETFNSDLSASSAKILEGTGEPRQEFSYQDLSQFTNLVESNKSRFEDIRTKLSKGSGISPWFPAKRKQLAASIEEILRHNIEIAAQAKISAQAVQDIHEKTASIIGLSSNTRLEAVGALNSGSDNTDFQAHIQKLVECSQKLPQVTRTVDMSKSTNQLTGVAEYLRLGMVQKMAADLKSESGLLKSRLAATRKANNLLAQYKSQVDFRIQSSAGVVAIIGGIANRLQPAVDRAFQASRPVRESLNSLNTVYAGKTALAWMSDIDPSIGMTARVLEGLCSGVESVRRVLGEVIGANRPLNDSIARYRASRSRDSIKEIANSSLSAASFYSSKTNMFDPVLLSINEAEQKVNRLYALGGQIRNFAIRPIVNNILNGVANSVNFLLSSARSPFEEGKRAISSVATSLTAISDYEKSYLSSLNSLAEESPYLATVDQASSTIAVEADMNEARNEEESKKAATKAEVTEEPTIAVDAEAPIDDSLVEKSTVRAWEDIPAEERKQAEFEAAARFVVNGNGTITDIKTNLMWAAQGSDTGFLIDPAVSYYENFSGGGYTDWRMPTGEELKGLYDERLYYHHTMRIKTWSNYIYCSKPFEAPNEPGRYYAECFTFSEGVVVRTPVRLQGLISAGGSALPVRDIR